MPEERANGIRAYTDKTRLRGLKKIGREINARKSGEWNSRLYRQNPPTRVEENRANGIRAYTDKTRRRGLKSGALQLPYSVDSAWYGHRLYRTHLTSLSFWVG